MERLRITVFPWQAMLDEKSPKVIGGFRGFVSLEFGFVGADDGFPHNDEKFPVVLAYQFFLMFFIVGKFLIKRHGVYARYVAAL